MSFRRPSSQGASPSQPPTEPPRPGVRTSSAGTRVTSWGISGLDAATGGGLPLGSLTLIIEDTPTSHHEAFIRLFMAQGLAHGHAVALAQSTSPAAEVFAALPVHRESHQAGTGGAPGVQRPEISEESMRIAWRYAKAKAASTSVADGSVAGQLTPFRHNFDLSESTATAADAPVSFLGFGQSESLNDVLSDVCAHVRSAERKGLQSRVAVCGLDPDLWDLDMRSLAKFLHALRVSVERVGAVAVVTVPQRVYSSVFAREADIVLLVDSFGGQGAGLAGLGDEWLGIVSIEKRYRPPGALKAVAVEAKVWVYKRGRRKYVFEPAAAAPEETDRDDNASAEMKGNGASASPSGGLCAPGPQASKYDF